MTKTFSVVRSQKIVMLFSSLLFGFFFAWLAWIVLPTLDFSFEPGFGIRNLFPLFPLAMVAPFFLLAIWIALMTYRIFKIRLVFDGQGIHLVAPKILPGFLSGMLGTFSIPYGQVKAVYAKKIPGLLEIVKMNGKKHNLAASVFAKNFGEEVIVELKNRLPAESFKIGVEISALRSAWSRFNRISIVIVILYGLVYFAAYALQPLSPIRDQLTQAWEVETRLEMFEYLRTYSVDDKSGFWLVISSQNSYTVAHYTDKLGEQIELPDLGPSTYLQQASGDENGNPIVWTENGVWHYAQDNWRFIPYESHLDFRPGLFDVVAGPQAWAVIDGSLFTIEALTGKVTALPLPESAAQAGLSPSLIRKAANGNLLVLMDDKDIHARIYVLNRQNEWQATEYPLITTKELWVRDLFLSADGSLWVLMTGRVREEWLVEKITPDGQIMVTNLPVHYLDGDRFWRFQSIFVDTHGRLWVSGHREFISVFTPQWWSDAQEIQRYTDNNSNYVEGLVSGPFMDANGRIWAFDRKISTMDTSLAELPEPLPGWLVNLDISFIQLVIMILFLASQMVWLSMTQWRMPATGKK